MRTYLRLEITRMASDKRFLILMLAMPDDDRAATNELLRPQRGLHRLDWTEDRSVNFHLSHGDWIALLRANGLGVERLAELYPAEGATTDFPYVTPDWARQWPSEEVWVAAKPRRSSDDGQGV